MARFTAPDEAITIEEAVRGYTLTSAFINFDEDIKGSLEPGKYADMIVLPADILTLPKEELMALDVAQTYLQEWFTSDERHAGSAVLPVSGLTIAHCKKCRGCGGGK